MGTITYYYEKARRFLDLARTHYTSTTHPGDSSTGVQILVNSMYFKSFVSFTIVVNSICIGCQTDDYLKTHLSRKAQVVDGTDTVWRNIEILFCIFFAGELILRAAAERLAFVFGENWGWNLFDFCLVLFAVVDLLTSPS